MQHKGTVELYTDRVFLRKFKFDDASAMYKNWQSDPEVTKYLTWQAHQNINETKAVLDSWISQYAKPDFYQWAIALEGSCEPIGSISVVDCDEKTNTLEIGYCIGQEWWHQGYTKRALKLVIKFLFEEVKAERLIVKHDVNNPNSGLVAKTCGMHYIETQPEGEKNNQGISDAVVYALNKDEYLAENKPLKYDFSLLTRFEDTLKQLSNVEEDDEIVFKVFSSLKSTCSGYSQFGLPNHCATILKQHNISIIEDNLKEFDVEKMDAQCVLAFMLGIYNAERYYDEVVINAFNEKIFSRCIERLNKLAGTDE